MFHLGIINDEVTRDFEETCGLIASWGLRHVELRVLWGKNVLLLDDAQVEEAAAIVHRHGLTVTGIASPVFKSPLDGRPLEREADFSLPGVESAEAQTELLTRACKLATRFGARLVRVFSFWREPWTPEVDEALVARFAAAADVARRHDVMLGIENEPVCIVGTGRELGRLRELLEARLTPEQYAHVGLLWDPGNARALGELDAYPGGFAAVAGPKLVHVHVKDLVPVEGGRPHFVPTGEGVIDYSGQFRALAAAGYRGSVVLEPHYQPAGEPDAASALTCVRATRDMLAELGLLAQA